MGDLTEEALRRKKIKDLERSIYQVGRRRSGLLVDFPGEVRNVSEYSGVNHWASRTKDDHRRSSENKKPFHYDTLSAKSRDESSSEDFKGNESKEPETEVTILETELLIPQNPILPSLNKAPKEEDSEDMFESISRAVTARNRMKSQRTKTVQQVPENAILELPSHNSGRMNVTTSQDQSGLSFFAALFQGPKEKQESQENKESEKDEDFLLALFISEPTGRKNGKGESEGNLIGHFCSKETPGFCQANFCIFHYQNED